MGMAALSYLRGFWGEVMSYKLLRLFTVVYTGWCSAWIFYGISEIVFTGVKWYSELCLAVQLSGLCYAI